MPHGGVGQRRNIPRAELWGLPTFISWREVEASKGDGENAGNPRESCVYEVRLDHRGTWRWVSGDKEQKQHL